MSRKYQDEEWLQEKYAEGRMSQSEIADLCDCTQETISYWLRKYNIQTRSVSDTPDDRLKDEVWMESAIEEYSVPEIAEICDAGETTVRRWLDEHGIDRPTLMADKRLRDEGWVSEKYLEDGMSAVEIGDLCGCASQTVYYWLRKHGIEPRDKSISPSYPELADRDWLQEQYVEKRKSLVEIGDLIGCSDTAVLSWLRNHRIERRSVSESVSGELHPNWKGGRSFYAGPNWQEQRQKALRRDGFKCQCCGIDQSELGQELDVHHIVPRSDFISDDGTLDYEKANEVDNLISLCKSCHSRWERLSPLRPVVAD